MSEPSGPDAARASVNRARLSPVWLIPIVAIALVAYLGYRTFTERGPTITLQFETAEGVEAGKTRVKFRSVEIGAVTDVEVKTGDHPTILVTCELDPKAEPFIVDGSQFWVVRPRIGFSGVSGLETLVSGGYIEFVPGAKGGKPQRYFVGLEKPPETRRGPSTSTET